MSQLIEIGVTGSECPYCGKTLPKRPTRKSKCKFCEKPIFVRTRPLDERSVLLREDQVPVLEEQWEAASAAQSAKDDQRDFKDARQYTEKAARDYMKQPRIQFLQVRLSSKHEALDACDFYADADLWGLGRGVYPKAEAPVPPFHIGCRCTLSPRIDLPNKTPVRRQTEAAALQAGFTPAIAAQIQAQINSGQFTIKKVKDC